MKVFLIITLFMMLSADPLSAQLREGVVKRVIDGDTIELSTGEAVRYIGVSAPKIFDPIRLVDKASEFNRNLVEGKTVKLEFDEQEKDPEGHLLAYVYCDDVFVNAEIIKQGYGLIEIHSPNTKHAEYFIKLEQEARSAKRGVWSGSDMVSAKAQDTISLEERITLVETSIRELSAKIDQILEIIKVLQFQPKDTSTKPGEGGASATLNLEKQDGKPVEEAEIVYVTRSGKRYHKLGCRFLVGEPISITIEEAKRKGLQPCKICFPQNEQPSKGK